MFDLFSDFFACRDNLFTRMDSRVKMIVASCLILAVIFSTQITFPLVVSVACVSTMIALRIPVKLVIVRLFGPMGIVSALVAVQAFSAPGHSLFSFSLFGWTLTATREGFAHGVLLGSRVIGAVSVVLLLGSVTPAHKIFHALRWFKVPEAWVEIALLIYRYSFTLADQTVDVAEAQKLRLGYSSVRKSISSMGVLTGTVITRSMDQAMRTYEAMTLRGYHGKLIFDPLPKMTGAEITSLLIAAPMVLISYVVVEWWSR